MGTSCAGRVAVVTGASRGIGAAVARRLAAEGARVVVTARTLTRDDHHLPGSLEETVAAIADDGGEAVAVVADLGDPGEDRGRIVERAEEAFGQPVDILVNNAAAAFYMPFLDVSEKRFRVAVEVNVRAPWELMQRVVPGMRARGRGWVLNVSSRTAQPPEGPPFRTGAIGGACIYGGTKAMLDRFSVGAAAELYDGGIAVNVLSPEAAVATPGATALVDLPDEYLEPEETVAEAALALCSGDPAGLTGRVAFSLSLLRELGRPVRTLDGAHLVEGWQPDDIDPPRVQGPAGEAR